MKKKKGFTLIELLGILTVLGLIVIIAFPNIVSLISKTTKKEYERFLKDIELATEVYVEQNKNKVELKDPFDYEFIELGTLVEGGYLNQKLINPKTEEEINLNSTVLVTVLEDKTKKYEYTDTVAGVKNYFIPGLLIMYDGYEKPTESGSNYLWKNIIGTSNNGMVDGSLTWEGNKIKLENDKDITADKSSTLVPNNSNITIEIVYKGYEVSETWQFNNSGLGLGYFSVYDDGEIKAQIDGPNFIEVENSTLNTLDTLHTLTMTMEESGGNYKFKIYGDGELLEEETGTKFSSYTNFTIGSHSGASAFSSVYIHNFRLYNQVLTKDEVKRNHQIDKNRYDWR